MASLPGSTGDSDADEEGLFPDDSNYTRVDQIGRGTYGSVFKAVSPSGDLVALKRIDMDYQHGGFPVTAIREIKIMRSLQHPNILPIVDVVASKDAHLCHRGASVYCVFPYMEYDLSSIIESPSVQMTPSQAKYYMGELLRALSYLHSNRVLHRDLKASNVLVGRGGQVRLADFGLARFQDIRCKLYTNRVVTLWYRAPELLLGFEEYDGAIDMWAAGCIFAELLTKKTPFPGSSEMDTLERVFRLCGTPTTESWPEITSMPWFEEMVKRRPTQPRMFEKVFRGLSDDEFDLLEGLLTCDPSVRLTASQALEHSYFSHGPKPMRPEDHPEYAQLHDLKTRRLKTARRDETRNQRDANALQLAQALPSVREKKHRHLHRSGRHRSRSKSREHPRRHRHRHSCSKSHRRSRSRSRTKSSSSRSRSRTRRRSGSGRHRRRKRDKPYSKRTRRS